MTIERFDAGSPADAIEGALADFNRIYQLTAARAGFVARAPGYYERVWRIFAAGGRVRLSFAVLDRERVATLFHFLCGDRVVEAYGGMTDAGAEARAGTSSAPETYTWSCLRSPRGHASGPKLPSARTPIEAPPHWKSEASSALKKPTL